MNSIKRIKESLMHREPDRIPLDIGGTRVTGIHIEAYRKYRHKLGLPPSNPGMQILYLQLPKIDADFRSMLGVDLESVDPDTSHRESKIRSDDSGQYYTDMWGCEWFMPDKGLYFDIRKFPLASAESVKDVEAYSWPEGDNKEILANIESDALKVWKKNRRAVMLGRTCPGIFEMCAILCGHEKAMLDLASNPSLSEAIMDNVLEHKLNFYRAGIERLLSAGVECFIISESDDFGAQKGLLISPDMYRRMVKPRHTQLFNAIKKYSGGRAFIELHSCGSIRELIPDYIESGVEILNPVQVSADGMDTRELKKEFGKDIVFHGGGVDSQHTLPYGTPQEVRDEVCRRIEDLAPGGGFIFTPVHSIQHDVPFENFKAMVETYYQYA